MHPNFVNCVVVSVLLVAVYANSEAEISFKWTEYNSRWVYVTCQCPLKVNKVTKVKVWRPCCDDYGKVERDMSTKEFGKYDTHGNDLATYTVNGWYEFPGKPKSTHLEVKAMVFNYRCSDDVTWRCSCYVGEKTASRDITLPRDS